MSESIINVSSLTRRFGAKTALDSVSLSLPCGQVNCVVGGNGAGKTTLIKHILGLLRPESGAVRVEQQFAIHNIHLSILIIFISIVSAMGLVFLENFLRRGDVLDFGYPGTGFQNSLRTGLGGLLASPTRGIIFLFLAFLFHRTALQKTADPIGRTIDFDFFYRVHICLMSRCSIRVIS